MSDLGIAFSSPGRQRPSWLILGLAGLLLLSSFLTGCTARQYRERADREVSRIIAQKGKSVPNMEPNFTIETNAMVGLDDLTKVSRAADFLGQADASEVGAVILPLERALKIAFKNSRTYQNRKELLYLDALSLTLTRYRYTPIFSAGAGASYRKTAREVQNGVDRIIDEHSVNVGTRATGDMLLRSGGRIAASFTTDFLRFLTGDPRVANSSALVGTLSQPLLRGAGYKVATETLTQAERSVLYSLRDFAQFRQDYSVQIASSYYQILQNRDTVKNLWLGFQAFKRSAERERAFAQEGQRKLADLGRLQQEELNNETSWINAVRAYKQNLDQFKVQLGLSADAHLVLDETELTKMRIAHPKIALDDAVRVALENRLDLYTVRDRFEDAARKTDLAKNGLLPDLDLVLSANVASKPGTGLPELDFNRVGWNAGLDLDLPLNRKAERNSYRTALISYQQAARALELAVDNIKLDVYDSWRRLDQANRNYQSSELGVDLSQRRVYEQDLLAELGRGTAEAKVAAQNSLISSLNQRTSALVNHTIARLSFWRDLGVLYINSNGQWEEIADATKP